MAIAMIVVTRADQLDRLAAELRDTGLDLEILEEIPALGAIEVDMDPRDVGIVSQNPLVYHVELLS